jgi:hypothetical protein
VSERPSPTTLLETPGALLNTSDLRKLGWSRAAIDVLLRHVPVVAIPGYRRLMVRREDVLAFIAEHTYDDDRVRPT